MGEDINQILMKALDESGGETIDIVIENELPGITQEMYEWWHRNMRQTRLYKMWHPSHISFEQEESGDPEFPFIGNPTEMLGEYGPSTMRFKGQPQSRYPFKPKYKNYGCAVHLSPDGTKELSLMCSEYEEGPNGLKVLKINRWPAKTPQGLVDALKKHEQEERENFPKFLPELYKKEGGKGK